MENSCETDEAQNVCEDDHDEPTTNEKEPDVITSDADVILHIESSDINTSCQIVNYELATDKNDMAAISVDRNDKKCEIDPSDMNHSCKLDHYEQTTDKNEDMSALEDCKDYAKNNVDPSDSSDMNHTDNSAISSEIYTKPTAVNNNNHHAIATTDTDNAQINSNSSDDMYISDVSQDKAITKIVSHNSDENVTSIDPNDISNICEHREDLVMMLNDENATDYANYVDHVETSLGKPWAKKAMANLTMPPPPQS